MRILSSAEKCRRVARRMIFTTCVTCLGRVGSASDPQTSAGEPRHPTVAGPMTVKVSQGDSLWRISREAYGTGSRYAIIFGANHNQTRNPNRIYPGQVFVVPEKAR
jgi:nucleoid-associated protein YgaU